MTTKATFVPSKLYSWCINHAESLCNLLYPLELLDQNLGKETILLQPLFDKMAYVYTHRSEGCGFEFHPGSKLGGLEILKIKKILDHSQIYFSCCVSCLAAFTCYIPSFCFRWPHTCHLYMTINRTSCPHFHLPSLSLLCD